jgi:hypothetical protein
MQRSAYALMVLVALLFAMTLSARAQGSGEASSVTYRVVGQRSLLSSERSERSERSECSGRAQSIHRVFHVTVTWSAESSSPVVTVVPASRVLCGEYTGRLTTAVCAPGCAGLEDGEWQCPGC